MNAHRELVECLRETALHLHYYHSWPPKPASLVTCADYRCEKNVEVLLKVDPIVQGWKQEDKPILSIFEH